MTSVSSFMSLQRAPSVHYLYKVLHPDPQFPVGLAEHCAEIEMKMPVLRAVHLVFSFLYPIQSNSETDCKLWKDLDSTVVYKEGHVVLAGMFPIHSKGIDQEINFRSQPDQRKCRG